MNAIIKVIICFLVSICISHNGFCETYLPKSDILPADCNCQKMMKDGVVVLQCPPSPVANDNATQIGLSASSINNNDYVGLTIRFSDKAMEIDKSYELSLWFEDGNVIDLKYLNGGLGYIGNSQVAQGLYSFNADQEIKLKASRIKTLAFKLTDGLRRTYQIKMNSDIICKQLKCIAIEQLKPEYNSSDTFDFLKKFDGKYPFDVELLDIPILKERLINLLGNRYDFLRETWGVSFLMVYKDNIFTAGGCQPHNCNRTNFIIVVDIAMNKIYVGIREEDQVKTYSEGGSYCNALSVWAQNKD